MYFLFSKPRGWGKPPAIRPQTHLRGVAFGKEVQTMKKEYEALSVEVVKFEAQDVITASTAAQPGDKGETEVVPPVNEDKAEL